MANLVNGDERKLRLVISSTFDAEPIKSHMKWWVNRFLPNKFEDFTFLTYQLIKDLLYPKSEFLSNSDIRIIFNRFEDWIRDDDRMTETEKCKKLESALRSLLQLISKASKAHPLIVGVFPVSTEAGLSNTLYHFMLELNEQWRNELQKINGVQIIDFVEAQNIYGVVQPFDYVKDNLSHMPFSDDFDAVIGTYLIRHINAMYNDKYKVIVLDCDNTLWDGICGETNEVLIDEYFIALQRMMLVFKENGMLLTICSKNNEQDVWTVFENHQKMLLKREDFVCWRINWESKSDNIIDISRELNVGIESFIFIDDSPVECAEVMIRLPQVHTLKLPDKKNQIPSFLTHVWAFDKNLVTQEDRERTARYQIEIQRKDYLNHSEDRYMENLQLEVHFDQAREEQLSRLAQLTQRTNQFNASIIRRTEQQLKAMLESNNIGCWAVEVIDRFGSYGLTGLLITEISGNLLRIETFLLSCRVLGRGVESAILSMLKTYCQEHSIESFELMIVDEPRNQPIRNFLVNSGWTAEGRGGSYLLYRLGVEHVPDEIAYVKTYFRKGLPNSSKENNRNTVNHIQPETIERDDGKGEMDWEVFVENESHLLHRVQLLPLEHVSPVQLKLLPYQREFLRSGDIASPETELEKAILDLLGQIVGVKHWSVCDSIVEITHNRGCLYSLVARIYERYGVLVELDSLSLEEMTVRHLAESIEKLIRKESLSHE